MINTHELRIGNLLLSDTQELVKIDSIINITAVTDDKLGCYECNQIFPISLTREILEKVGFEYSGNHVYEYKDNSNILFDEPEDWNNIKKYPIGIAGGDSNYFLAYFPKGEVIIRCLYLHQLQNMYFAIIGQELNVDNIINESNININK